jgi:hypothetical protein
MYELLSSRNLRVTRKIREVKVLDSPAPAFPLRSAIIALGSLQRAAALVGQRVVIELV